MIYVMTTVQI